ncbi:hypothetical protein LTR04_002133 [Oleoguttula sp. CCFEE 6159]|nr:hypothetical protein LTR04_002133 [Oleoguttula sp. CCFEE 6159]
MREHLLLGGLQTQYQIMYERAIDVVKRKLIFRPLTKDNADILVSGSFAFLRRSGNDKQESATFIPHNSHLTCFAGGMMALGAKLFGRHGDLSVAEKLTDGCVYAYEATATGVMPEEYFTVPCPSIDHCIWNETLWREKLQSTQPSTSRLSHDEYMDAKIRDERLTPGLTEIRRRSYILRPETIESVFYLYRITGNERWREKGWKMFQAIEAATHTRFGNSAIDDVTVASPKKTDVMQSFWTAETLKYFWLLFSHEDVVSLDDYVL